MPQQTIDIPGVGLVEFPDGMSDAEITAAARRMHDEATSTTPAWRPAPPEATPLPESARWQPTREQAIEMMMTEARMPIVDPSSTLATVVREAAPFMLGGGAVAKGVSALPRVAQMGRWGQAATHGATQASTAFAVDAMQRGEVSPASAVPAVIAGATPVAGAGLRAGAEALVKNVLPLHVADQIKATFPTLKATLKTGAPTQTATPTPAPTPAPSPKASSLDRMRNAYRHQQKLVEAVLHYGLRGNKGDITRIERSLRPRQTVSADRVTAAMDTMMGLPQELSRTLATRQTAAAPPLITGGLSWLFGGPGMGLGAAGATHAAQRYPLHTAHLLNWLASQAGRQAMPGAAASVASQLTPDQKQLTPEQAEMVRLLIERQQP